MKKATRKTVYQSKKIDGITYNVKSIFSEKEVSEKMEKLIEKEIAQSPEKTKNS